MRHFGHAALRAPGRGSAASNNKKIYRQRPAAAASTHASMVQLAARTAGVAKVAGSTPTRPIGHLILLRAFGPWGGVGNSRKNAIFFGMRCARDRRPVAAPVSIWPAAAGPSRAGPSNTCPPDHPLVLPPLTTRCSAPPHPGAGPIQQAHSHHPTAVLYLTVALPTASSARGGSARSLCSTC